MGKLDSKIALVTGASRGIGRQTALLLAREGAEVILSATSEELLFAVAQQIRNAGGTAHVRPADLADEQSILKLTEQIKSEFDTLDILVNNAGITLSASLQETSTSDWKRVMNINALGPFLLCRELIELLKKSQSGRIVNVSSVVGIKGYASQIAYTMSKHALRGMTIALANELQDTSVRVHVVCPGGVDTDMVSRVRPDIAKEALMDPQEIAELILYLVSHTGNAVVDELHIRRKTSDPWFS